MDSTRTIKRLEMLQDYPMKYKKLKQNLSQSQNLNKQLKQQLLKLGSQCNTILIFVTTMSSKITDLKSQLLKAQKQLAWAKQQQRRISYKTQKVQIKQKQYTQRVRRFQQMHTIKHNKNLTLKQKIQCVQQRLAEQKFKQQQLVTELNGISATTTANNKQREYFSGMSVRSNRGSVDVGVNSCYEGEMGLVRNEARVKKLRQEKGEAERKNANVKSSINKLQQQISQLNDFLSQNTSLPYFREPQSLTSSITHNNPPSLQSSRTTTRLPSHIASSLSNFQNIKSKTILSDLVQKHDHIIQSQDVYVRCLEENYRLIAQLSEVNKIMGAGIMEESAKIAAFALRGKLYTDKRRKSIA